MLHENGELVSVLKNFNCKLYYLPNPGNAGDSLIACATMQFFDKHDLAYEIVLDQNFDPTGKVVVYAGGGNFGGENSRLGRFLKKFMGLANHFVILPHTIFGAEDLLSQATNNCFIFCREDVSFEHVKKNALKANVFLQHDMVFTSDIRQLMVTPPYLNFPKLLMREVSSRIAGTDSDYYFFSLKGFYYFHLYFMKKLIRSEGENGQVKILYGFRKDVEKTNIKIPEGNVDLSGVLELSACDPILAKKSCHAFLNEINNYHEVYTNRLHMAIAAAMLGKQVKLFDNNYYKNSAIYDFSIRGNFEKVIFVDSSSGNLRMDISL